MNALAVGATVGYQYDLRLVVLSFLISVFGSYVAMWLASGRENSQVTVYGPAVALGGCAIWAMHFIGMAAYKTQLYVSYAVVPTVLSLLIAIVFTAFGFHLALKGTKRLWNLLPSGIVIGSGAAAMHYLGMFGMDLRATIDWDLTMVAVSVAIAIAAATVAIWLTFHVKTGGQRIFAAVIMGIAVCAMHYTGMAAATLVCVAQANRSELGFEGPYLAYLTFGVALIALGASVAFGRIDVTARRLP
ncbi:MHYT domain-containing protein [Methylibium sp.]|uniref:MHYT domain-containing protein n=1 Tax=Methylibium sp. TaxID=2067992 RepID=UPI003D09EFFB